MFKIRTEDRKLRLATVFKFMNFETFAVLQQGPQWCSSLIAPSPYFDFYAALICGLPLPPSSAKSLIIDSGLIHILVVSGAHLVFVESLLLKLPFPLRWLGLLFYCWLTGFGAPVVKAFLYRNLSHVLHPRGWTPLWIDALTLICLLLAWPKGLFSLSLQMSWMCSLALSFPAVCKWKPFDQALKVYLLLFVYTGAGCLTLFWNTFLAPLVGLILFPLCLLAIVLPALTPFIDRAWDLFLWLLEVGPKASPTGWSGYAADLFWLPPLVHLLLLRRDLLWRRKQAFSC